MNVLVTRPSPAGKQLVAKLTALNIHALHTPLIQFAPGHDLPVLYKQLTRLLPGDLLLALSPRALHYALPIIRQHHFSWSPQLRYFAIGKSTAALLFAACKHPVDYPVGKEISEELLQLPALLPIAGKRALLLRGNGGRDLLAHTLSTRGADVTLCECYQRQPISYDATAQTTKWQAESINTIVITSGEMLQQLYTLVPDTARHWLLTCRLIVVSERLATLARQLGWQCIQVAENADNDALIRALQ